MFLYICVLWCSIFGQENSWLSCEVAWCSQTSRIRCWSRWCRDLHREIGKCFDIGILHSNSSLHSFRTRTQSGTQTFAGTRSATSLARTDSGAKSTQTPQLERFRRAFHVDERIETGGFQEKKRRETWGRAKRFEVPCRWRPCTFEAAFCKRWWTVCFHRKGSSRLQQSFNLQICGWLACRQTTQQASRSSRWEQIKPVVSTSCTPDCRRKQAT